jgi:NADH:ubiquinone oxidoreductase subunit 5 (subunit L)/multisubunit Na+/H+ antiporter MnhA subunit
MASKTRKILLIISVVILIPSLIFAIIIGRKFNKPPDAYNQVESDQTDKHFAWVLLCLYLGFFLLFVSVLWYIKEKRLDNSQVASIPNVNRSLVGGIMKK